MSDRYLPKIIKILPIVVLTLFSLSAVSDDLKPVPEEVKTGFDSINATDAIAHVEFLASDELEGRDTSSKGLRIAHHYIKSLYRIWGVAPAGDVANGQRTFEQSVELVRAEHLDKSCIEIKVDGSVNQLKLYRDFWLSRLGMIPGRIEGGIVFAGYGISAPELGYDDFAGVDIREKIVIVLAGLPGENIENSPFSNSDVRDRYNMFYGSYDNKVSALKERGAAAVLMVFVEKADPFDYFLWIHPPSKRRYKQGRAIESEEPFLYAPATVPDIQPVPLFKITERTADWILSKTGRKINDFKHEIDDSLKPHSIEVENTNAFIEVGAKISTLRDYNVLGMIEGSDPELKHEIVVIGAHLDHLGRTRDGYVFNGADDNASGSSGVLELAQAFALNPVKPKRTILFAHWTGEERWLLGSRYFVACPTIPLENIVACLNMDMIGRNITMERFEQQRNNPQYKSLGEVTPEVLQRMMVLIMSSQSPELTNIFKCTNEDHIGMICNTILTHSIPAGSDHEPFHRHQIPAAFIGSGSHDDYHTPADTSEKLDGDKMSRIIKLVYLVTWEVADRKERLEWLD